MLAPRMPHRFLGNSGLLVSKLSLGSWMLFDDRHTADGWYAIMAVAFKHGINFFDTAETYGDGRAEEFVGHAIKKGIADGIWSREDLVVTTKLFSGTKGRGPDAKPGPNDQGVSRKHLVEGTRASLRRMQLDYVDVLFCHRSEPFTPIEETVRAMNFIINQGWALYWGTSEWLSSEIIEACEIADRLGLIRPIVEQPEYNLFARSKVDFDYVNLYKKYKLGLMTWSPLAYGVLTGKYSAGAPEGSRFASGAFVNRAPTMEPPFETRVAMADKLKAIADGLGCSLAQFSIAWCAANDNVSTVLLGASRPEQLEENLKALEIVDQITPELRAKVDAIVDFRFQVPKLESATKMRARFL
ncbi:hypothetical protein BBJ28_00019326 [Nothophytophthora sp. Chile5]|nr:hypothetical protein BBJ28_00019326 [Nothophytophthora sp. Chile5]